ncbi:hypothetical protein, partial [Helicobacter sp.]|uniref:hypothetical protein n=1 Tax=Helicobacter sp. TaxID=218 RepID=UPI002A91F6F0
MQNQSIILLGGSNSVRQNGLQLGLKEAIEAHNTKLNQNFANKFTKNSITRDSTTSAGGAFLEFYNLALGATTSIQNLYELKRERNREILKNAALIITESNINEAEEFLETYGNIPLEVICRNLEWFYQELNALNKTALSIIFPANKGKYEIINQIHRTLCVKYGINCIDLHAYYKKNNVMESWKQIDDNHPFPYVLRVLGRNIIASLESFSAQKSPTKTHNVEFAILKAEELEANLTKHRLKNSMYDETTYQIDANVRAKFPERFFGYYPIGIHTWNNFDGQMESLGGNEVTYLTSFADTLFSNSNTQLIRESCFLNNMLEMNYANAFCIDSTSFISANPQDNGIAREKYHLAYCYFNGKERIVPTKYTHINLIAIFLAKGDVAIKEIDIEALQNPIAIPQKYNFDRLIPPIKQYEEAIDTYCAIVDPMKFHHYNAQLNQAQQYINAMQEQLTTAYAQIQEYQNLLKS